MIFISKFYEKWTREVQFNQEMIFFIDLFQNPRLGYKKTREKNLKIDFFEIKKLEYFEAGQLEGKSIFYKVTNKISSKYERE